MFSVFLCQAGLLRGEVPVLPQRKADVGSSPTLHWTGNTVTINTLNSSSINLLHFPSYLSLVRSRSCSVVLGSDDAIWNYIMSLLVWKNKTSNVRTQCLFLATVPEADVCSGSGSWCLGKPIWTDPRSVWGSGGLLLWTLPGKKTRWFMCSWHNINHRRTNQQHFKAFRKISSFCGNTNFEPQIVALTNYITCKLWFKILLAVNSLRSVNKL